MRRLFYMAIGIIILISSGTKAFAFGGCEEDCMKCHAIEKKEVQDILNKLKVTDANILDIRMSPLKGLWEARFDTKGTRGVMYIGFSKKYIINGPIYEVETTRNKTLESLAEVDKPVETTRNKTLEPLAELNKPVDRYVDTSTLSFDNTLLLGDKDAGNRILVFTDPDCPFCGKLHQEIKKVTSERKDIAFYLKLMPLKFHPDAHWKSQTIICANSLQFLEDNFEKKAIPKPDCNTKVPDENLRMAAELGITGTPTMIMSDGLVVIGARDSRTITELAISHKKKESVK